MIHLNLAFDFNKALFTFLEPAYLAYLHKLFSNDAKLSSLDLKLFKLKCF